MVELVAGLIDVFADSALTGNPLAVVQGADDLSDDEMRRIAGEFNRAETTFIIRSTCADWKLRSFTASGAEVFGAGHNAPGSGLGSLGVSARCQSRELFNRKLGKRFYRLSLS
ncbi:PhzF family phenazine biosynthesis protein [Pseudomonas sp. NBRC 111137]|uniref:PhzF family phenazine biosynthesis protein n=1 Tax=Pseudomonas sp. NBRC 111137 TaxID=1661052 RepID=UPI000AC379CE